MRLSKPFIRLPYRFDAPKLAEEAAQFGSELWLPHPSRMRGNSAIPLISSGGRDNDSFEGEKRATPHLRRCAYHQQVMAGFGEVLSRSRLMRLDAGAEVGLHVDFNYHWTSRVRIHIPVITSPEVLFQCGGETLHMAAGECWIFDSWRRHRVVNGGSRERVHLVVDLCGSSRFWRLVERVESSTGPANGVPVGGSLHASPDGSSHAGANEVGERFVAFEPDKRVTLRLERFSSLPVMAPGECAALIEDLIADYSDNPENDPALMRTYGTLLRGFARDWRELWSLYGLEPRGVPHYRALIEGTRQRLHPNRRALTTASNDIGVNAVFAQRVLNAALAAGGDLE